MKNYFAKIETNRDISYFCPIKQKNKIVVTFSIALLLLLVGYWTYGSYMNRIFSPDPKRKTPALAMTDGVDFIPLPTWKVFMIQFLNIAGLGPIFGAIMGAQFGTASYLWIVFGTIFAGAVHDFLSGTLSIRHSGESLTEMIGRYLGPRTKRVSCVFTVLLMILVGAVFVSGPAELLAGMTPEYFDIYFISSLLIKAKYAQVITLELG